MTQPRPSSISRPGAAAVNAGFVARFGEFDAAFGSTMLHRMRDPNAVVAGLRRVDCMQLRCAAVKPRGVP